MRPKLAGIVSVGLLSAFLLTSCANPAQSPGASGSDSARVSITVYTSEPQAKIDEVVEAFEAANKAITVEVFRAGTGDLSARIESERTSGKVQADVLLAADAATFESYAAQNLLLKYTPADVAALNPEVVDAEGFYTGTRIIPTVIAYNTVQITDPPKSWQALTEPAYSKKIIMPNPDVSGAAAYNAAVWLGEPKLGKPWLQALATNEPTIAESNGPVAEGVAGGAQPIGIVVDYLIRELAAKGSPVAVSYPEEGVPYVSQPAGIFASTEHAQAAQKFVDFLVSAEGQKLAVKQSYLPVRKDVGSPEGAPPMADLATLNPDLPTIVATQDEAVRTFNELFK